MKNCYYCFDGFECQDCYYSYGTHYNKNCVDCYYVRKSELLYDCTNMEVCYNLKYSCYCKQASDSYFLFNCRNVQNCFMSSNLRNKSYYLFNKQVTKEEYEKFIAAINFSDYKTILDLKKQFLEEIVEKTPIPPFFLENCENVTGNLAKNCSNVERAFESRDLKDGYNCFQAYECKDIMNCYMSGINSEGIFQGVATGIESYYCKNCAFVWHSANMEYCYLCVNCQDCFGCIGLRKKQYCILNKQYTKEEYEQTKKRMIESMRERGEYGMFFPAELNPFHYEDTIASDIFGEGNRDIFEKEYTAYQNLIVDSSSVQTCPLSGMAFRYTKSEIEFYTKEKIPLPRVAFPMRHKARMELMNTGFEEKEIRGLRTTFRTPEKRNIVDEKTYEDSLK